MRALTASNIKVELVGVMEGEVLDVFVFASLSSPPYQRGAGGLLLCKPPGELRLFGRL